MGIDKLIESLPDYYSDVDRDLILRAYRTAEEAHAPQKRASGEPYITHCLAVAEILAELRVPPAVIAAGLLHDTVEDTEITSEDLQRDFGDEIARLVDGVTKLTELPRVSRGDQQAAEIEEEKKRKDLASLRGLPDPEEDERVRLRSRNFDAVNETLRKTFLAIDDDPRVPLIKLADRLHNIRTLRFMPQKKRVQIAQQTLDIFAPLASILGIWNIKWELEDLAFRYVDPERYKEIATKLEAKRSEREDQVQQIKVRLLARLSAAGIEADISGRPKHIFSIYRKMIAKQLAFEEVHDIRGVRIIVPDNISCYVCLGIIHSEWRPVPGQFDDYIANPKDNNYQSIHTAVYYDDGNKLEVQIRTAEMNEEAEFGIAAHWRYKDGSPQDESFRTRVNWLRKVMDWRQDV
ncbi:MAG TPA: HD domain-containing protein, partial [Anaerolineales bacterium]|nr:HD domain-containing protein [Anaerolineales bacterium]